MSGTFEDLRSHYDRITVSTIQVAFGLSILLHALALSGWLPKLPMPPMLPFEDPRQGRPSGALAVHLAPPPSNAPAPPPAPAIEAQPAPAHRTHAPKMASVPPVLALPRPAAPSAMAAKPPAEAARLPADQDFAASIEARRRSRETMPAPQPSEASAPAPPAETEQERHNREVAISLGLNRTPSFGSERQRGGGMFQIQRMGYDDAEFFFYGWNKNIKRNAQQMIEVRLGNNPNMQIAVVRKMIAIIREHVNGNFTWESQRLNKDVTLSARPDDNAGLEDFLMLEFFPDRRR
jgi:hypothetical protein